MTSVNKTSKKMKNACIELESALKNFETQEPAIDKFHMSQNKIEEMKKSIQFIKEQLDALSK